MKNVLGLDLGVSSIGWALIDEDDKKIIGLGSRIIPLTTDDKDEFSRGNAISKNQNRTLKRIQRRCYDRYQLRRKNLIFILSQNNMLPDITLIQLPKIELWKLRNDAVKIKLSLPEIGRLLLHLNQKRGYKSSRSEANMDKKDTEYVKKVKSRHELIKEKGLTIGQYFYENLKVDENYRLKEQVFPREAYIEEFDTIINSQKKYHSQILTDNLIHSIRDEIIYFQRRLKSQKGLVSVCDFEGYYEKFISNDIEKEIFVGPKVAHRSSPLFQVCKIWETINSISLRYKNGIDCEISLSKKFEIFNYLDNNEVLSYLELLKILNLKKDEVYGNKQLAKGLQGNKTKLALKKCFNNPDDFKHLFVFNLNITESDQEGYLIEKNTGEIVSTKNKKYIVADVEAQPLFKLWHVVYSIQDKQNCKQALIKKFKVPEEIAERLASLDFTKQGYGNKSHRAIRKILPFLMEGDVYSNACSYVGYNHSGSMTKRENMERLLAAKLLPIQKNSLRQPIVEKILNQLVNLVNAIIEKYGKPDEIRIELARELKQNKEERNETYKNITKRERENVIIEKELEEFGLRATRNNIIKWRLYHEISNEEKKQNAICLYCGQPISFSAALLGEEVEVEHIIPKSKIFDDSQSNKTLTHRRCNANKKDQTAYDYMKSKSETEFLEYIERVNILYKNGLIGKSKRDKLLLPEIKISKDFITRQLRETQYITKKAREILNSICHNIWVTSGTVTAELRHIWGWDEVLENLQLHKYRSLGLTETITISDNNNSIHKEKIIGWSKRDDHRHHAIDALTIACTKQGFIQRINNLSSNSNRNQMIHEIKDYDERKNLLENYLYSQRPYTTRQVEEAVANILVSFKSGKKVASVGIRKVKRDGRKIVVQNNIIVPRGPLSEESVYGQINCLEFGKPVKYLFENPNLIFKSYIKKLVEERLLINNSDIKSSLASLKKSPIYLDENKTSILKYATCFKKEYVLKYPVQSLKVKDVKSIIDNRVREIISNRLNRFNNNEKVAFKNLENDPIWFNEEKKIPIKTVRCFTGLSAVESIKKNEFGKDIGFVKPGNNHHLALYKDEFGVTQISICSFWHAVERKKFGIPIIIKNPAQVIDSILEDEDKYHESFLEKLPNGKWTYIESFQQNEMFILGLNIEDYELASINNKYNILSNYLYKLRSIAGDPQLDLYFEHHLETSKVKTEYAKLSKRYILVKSIGALFNLNPIRIKINYLGEIIKF
jgi:CRISPR-associated endonuclease Csn1